MIPEHDEGRPPERPAAVNFDFAPRNLAPHGEDMSDVRARLSRLIDALADGEISLACQIAEDLFLDLVDAAEHEQEAA